MTMPITQPLTVRTILFPEPADDPVSALASRLVDTGVARTIATGLRGLTTSTIATTNEEIATVIDGLLNLDLPALAIDGWRKHQALRAAARHTREARGSEEIVELATHRITSIYRPRIDLLVNEKRVLCVGLQVRITFDIRAVVGVVRAGYLVALRTGRADITAGLEVENVPLAEETRTIDLKLAVPLGTGIWLSGDDES